MSSNTRLVPIRPSPHKGGQKNAVTVITSTTSATSVTPPKSGVKRKLPDNSPEGNKCKRKINFSVGYVVSTAPVAPATVARRNQRERNRVKQVNTGFATLRQHIPGAAKAKKISKVETLKQAVDYIRSLQRLLDDHDSILTSSNVMSSPAPASPHHPASSMPYTLAATPAPHPQYQLLPYPAYYYTENVSPIPASVYPMSSSAVSPSCSSENSAASPTPSYDSQFSVSEGVTGVTSLTYQLTHTPMTGGYETLDYHPDSGTGCEDDELLDAIALWQQCQ